MGPIWATHMGSATGFGMGPIWVSPYVGCPDGSHMGSATGFGMGPIWVSPYVGCPDGSHMGPIKQPDKEKGKGMNSVYKLISLFIMHG